MKSVIIDTSNDSTVKLLLELAKRMGLKARVEEKSKMKSYPMPSEVYDNMLNESEAKYKTKSGPKKKNYAWKTMPDDEAALEEMIKKAEIDFKRGKGLTTDQMQKIIRSWK